MWYITMAKQLQIMWFLREKCYHVITLVFGEKNKVKRVDWVGSTFKQENYSFLRLHQLPYEEKAIVIFCIILFKIINTNKKLTVGICWICLVSFGGFIGQLWPHSLVFFTRNVSRVSELMDCEVLRNIPFQKSVLQGCDTNGRWPMGLWQNSPV